VDIKLKPLDVIYMVKAFLGALTAIVCLLLRIDNLFTAIGIAMLIYLISDRILRQIFIEKVERSLVTKTGIGIFIVTWLFLWIVLYTFMNSFLI